jgi:D-glycero-D-manno-heptose 1,7-bisphosphate phosphatase
MRLVILDRDGVINEDSPDYIRTVEMWKPIPGALDAVAQLTVAGYRVVVATNQSGVGRGHFDIETLNHIHDRMLDAVSTHGGAIEAIFFCPHLPDQQCECRKPRPGMLLKIAERLRVSLDNVPVVGDSERDLEAARVAGARPVLVRTGNGIATESMLANRHDVDIYDDLAAFARATINKA